jgi:hypothetical protein
MRNFIRTIALSFILLDNLFIPGDFSFDFRAHYIFYAIYIIYYLVTMRKVSVRLEVIALLLLLTAVLGLVPILRGVGVVEFIRQVALITFNSVFAYLLINDYDFDLERIFRDYFQLIYIASIVGAIQIISMMAGFQSGADYSYLGFDMQHFNMGMWAVQSWFQEPSFMAIAFIPAVFMGISRIVGLTSMVSKRKAVLIIIILILSRSSVGLFGLLVSLAIVMWNRYPPFRSPMAYSGLLVLCILMGLAFYSIPQVKLRVDDTYGLVFDERVTAGDIDKVNISTYSMYSNLRVAQSSFYEHPFFGSGLGTYESNYFEFIDKVVPRSRLREEYQLNEKDANSMLLRVASELGMFGLLLLFWFLVSNRAKVDFRHEAQPVINYWIINSSVLVLFLARLLRQGHYTMLGFTVFVMAYYLSRKWMACEPTSA